LTSITSVQSLAQAEVSPTEEEACKLEGGGVSFASDFNDNKIYDSGNKWLAFKKTQNPVQLLLK